jgi:hypothetical protein
MWRETLKVVAATALFGVVHSALASRGAKQKAAALFGPRQRNGLYRLFYVGKSLVTFGALAAYVKSLPDRELYHVRGPAAWLMHGGQALGLVYMTAAAHQVGIGRMLGLESYQAWARGDAVMPPEPEAQGPALGPDGRMRATGPFAHGRHPLNLSPLPIFWLLPRMTANCLTFNLTATAYLVIGSTHEEQRLLAAYGEPYRAYQRSGVPFYLPGPRELLAPPAITP